MKILYIAEIIGKPGIWITKTILPKLKTQYKPDFIISNANSATGLCGLGKQHAGYLKKIGINCLTAGDAIFQKSDLVEALDKLYYVLRPVNLPNTSPGRGWRVFNVKNFSYKIAVISALGRIGYHRIMSENPFVILQYTIEMLKKETKCIIIDFSSYATAEKQTLGFMMRGKVSAVIGSGTKVPTADAVILENKTAYITDAGRTGSLNSVGGCEPVQKINEYLTCLPNFNKDCWDDPVLQGVYLEISEETGYAVKIEQIFEKCLPPMNPD